MLDHVGRDREDDDDRSHRSRVEDRPTSNDRRAFHSSPTPEPGNVHHLLYRPLVGGGEDRSTTSRRPDDASSQLPDIGHVYPGKVSMHV